MSNCNNCGTGHADGIHFCTQCGQLLPPKNQGKKIDPENMQDAFNTFADGDILGAAFAKKPTAKQTTNKTTPPPSPHQETTTSTRTDELNIRTEKIKTIARAAAKGIAKSVALSLAVLGPGFVMLIMGMTVLGMLWLFVGSFAMMAWSYRKPWRLGAIACLIPPAAAAICYALQLLLFGIAAPPLVLIAGAGVAGLAVGFWRAGTHEVKRDASGAIIAERTIGYLLVWAIAYGATQLLGFIAISELAIRAGLITGAFTTAMLATVSIVVWRQFKQLKAAPVALILAVIVALSASVAPNEARAD
ncbi:MAG: zinc ribbon domain-containing protein, partial [Hyphomicrobiales bacterium]